MTFAPGERLGNYELLVELAVKCLCRRFACLNLAAGKLPFKGECLVLGPLAAQNFVATQDKRGRNLLAQSRFLIRNAAA